MNLLGTDLPAETTRSRGREQQAFIRGSLHYINTILIFYLYQKEGAIPKSYLLLLLNGDPTLVGPKENKVMQPCLLRYLRSLA